MPNLNLRIFCKKKKKTKDEGANGRANSADPDQTQSRSSLIWVCTVCPDLSVPKFRVITVVIFKKNMLKDLYM